MGSDSCNTKMKIKKFMSPENKDSKFLRQFRGASPGLSTMSSKAIRRKEIQIQDKDIDAEVYIWIEIYKYRN